MYLMTSIADLFFFFFFNDTATTEIYTLSLHDALPILQAQHFDIGDHEAAAFDGRRELRQGRDVAAREDVALYPWIVEVGHIAVADEVQQHHAIVGQQLPALAEEGVVKTRAHMLEHAHRDDAVEGAARVAVVFQADRKSTRLNSSHSQISYAVFCLKKKKKK